MNDSYSDDSNLAISYRHEGENLAGLGLEFEEKDFFSCLTWYSICSLGFVLRRELDEKAELMS